MKKTILFILAVSFSFSILLASGNPVEKLTLLETEAITIKTENNDASIFVKTSYKKSDKSLVFNTEVQITFVQIFNKEGDMEFQLPANSKNVKIGMSFFDKGDYKLGFIVDGKDNIQFAEINIR